MAWVDLSGAFTYGSTLTSTQMQNLRDNLAAAFAKDSGAPTLDDFYVESSMIGSCQIGAAHIDSYSITGNRIGTFAIINRCMAINSVTSSNILAGEVSSGHIAAGHVGSAHIAASSIGSSHLAPSSVGSGQIGALEIGSSHLNVYCVGNAQLDLGVVSTNRLEDGAVAQAKLDTVLGVETAVDVTPLVRESFDLDGGTYGFYPQVKCESGTLGLQAMISYEAETVYGPASYETTITLSHVTSINIVGPVDRELQVQQRYVNACSEVYFIFVLRYKDNKKIARIAFKPNHPAFMSGQDPENKPHPWVKIYDPNKHEIIAIFPSKKELLEMNKLQDWSWGTPNLDLTQVLRMYYDIKIDTKPKWPDTKVTMYVDPVTKQDFKFSIPQPDYIKTAKLVRKKVT